MRKVLACACGVVLVARDDEELLTRVEEHLTEVHAIPAPPAAGRPGRETNAMDESKRSPHLVTCGCGVEIWSEDAQELLALVEAHIRDAHPDLVGTLSPLELAEKARRNEKGMAA
jgi:predicted small metal-binding protein